MIVATYMREIIHCMLEKKDMGWGSGGHEREREFEWKSDRERRERK